MYVCIISECSTCSCSLRFVVRSGLELQPWRWPCDNLRVSLGVCSSASSYECAFEVLHCFDVWDNLFGGDGEFLRRESGNESSVLVLRVLGGSGTEHSDGELDTVAGAYAPGCRVDGDGHQNSGALMRSSKSRDAYANLSVCRQDCFCRCSSGPIIVYLFKRKILNWTFLMMVALVAIVLKSMRSSFCRQKIDERAVV